jgi:3-methyladenine DNA glycosylase/8-oxoguanine DNA glycosylase
VPERFLALREEELKTIGFSRQKTTYGRALAVAVQRVKRLRKRPTPERLQKVGEAWRPWRAVAARILWHYYLSSPRQPARQRAVATSRTHRVR